MAALRAELARARLQAQEAQARVQAQEAQVMRLASDLQSERERTSALEGQLADLQTQLANQSAEMGRLKEELAEKGRADEQMRLDVPGQNNGVMHLPVTAPCLLTPRARAPQMHLTRLSTRR